MQISASVPSTRYVKKIKRKAIFHATLTAGWKRLWPSPSRHAFYAGRETKPLILKAHVRSLPADLRHGQQSPALGGGTWASERVDSFSPVPRMELGGEQCWGPPDPLVSREALDSPKRPGHP